MTKKQDEEKTIEVELCEPLVKYDFSQDELVSIGERVATLARLFASVSASGTKGLAVTRSVAERA